MTILSETNRLKDQGKLIKKIEKKLSMRNNAIKFPEVDKFMAKEIDEAMKMRQASARMLDLCSEKRIEAVRKRHCRAFCEWRKEIEREKKRLKRESRRKDIRDCLRESEEAGKELGEIGIAVSWALRKEKMGVG